MNDSEGHDEERVASDDAGADRVPPGAGEPRQDEPSTIDDDEVEIIGDLGNEFDDPEGWMSERPGYWTELRELLDAPLPTRASLLRHRIAELILLLRSLAPARAPAWPVERVADSVWRKAAQEVLEPESEPDPEPAPEPAPEIKNKNRRSPWL